MRSGNLSTSQRIAIIISISLWGILLLSCGASCSEIGSVAKINTQSQAQSVKSNNIKIDYWNNGKPRLLTEYNDFKTVIGLADFYTDGKLVKERTFNRSAKPLSVANFNSRGGLSEGIDGWAAMSWSYDNGIMRGQGYYDSRGKLTEYLVFNELGDLVTKKYFGDKDPDDAELFSNSRSTAPDQSFEYYDSNGRLKATVSSHIAGPDDWFPLDYPYWYYGRYPYGLPDRRL